jgi:hypothetical protein
MSRLATGSMAAFLFLALTLGCAQEGSFHSADQIRVAQNPNAGPAGAQPPGQADESKPIPQARRIIYTCSMDLTVEDFDSSNKRLTTLIEAVQAEGGYLANHEIRGMPNSKRHGSWTIRVPLAGLDHFLAQVAELGTVERNTRDAKDITESFTDLEARLRNKEASEKRLLAHMEQSTKLMDTLEFEREITRVRGEIEQMQGHLNLLKNKSDLATVAVSLSQRPDITPPVVAVGFPTLIDRTFRTSINGLISCGQILTLMIVALSPWALTLGVILAPLWLIRRRTVRAEV